MQEEGIGVTLAIESDSHKLIYHPERVTEWRKKGDCYPIYVEIGVTNRCNHKCIFCALDWFEKKPQDLDIDCLKQALTNMASLGVKSVMFAGEGEPTLYPYLSDVILHANNAGLDIALATNGVRFSGDVLEKSLKSLCWVRYSLDAGSSESHHTIHRGSTRDFDVIIKNIHDAVYLKKKNNLSVVLGVQLLIIPDTINEIIPFIRLCKELGVDNVQIKPYSQHPKSDNQFFVDYSDIFRLESDIRSYESPEFQVILRKQTLSRIETERTYDMCLGLAFYTLIESDGNVIPCNLFHSDESYAYGNIHTDTFENIWESERRKMILHQLRENGISDCRFGCRLDAINRYLGDLLHPHPHVNFI